MFESLEDATAPQSTTERRLGLLFYLGLVAFALSFWLPSVLLKSDAIPGYGCAFLAARAGAESMKDNLLLGLCLLWAGLANAAVVVWLMLRLARAPLAWRRAVAFAALVGSIPCSLISIVAMKLVPIQGYFVWALGMAAMTFGEWRQTDSKAIVFQPE